MITKKTEYAIRAMAELAAHPDDLTTAAQLAQRQDIPPKYLPQIISELNRAGLLTSVRGFGGGVRLAHPAREISLLAIIEAMQGPMTMFECLVGQYECMHLPNCGLQGIYRKAQQELQKVYSQNTLADVKFRNRHGAHRGK